jgi:hypothetical protein
MHIITDREQGGANVILIPRGLPPASYLDRVVRRARNGAIGHGAVLVGVQGPAVAVNVFPISQVESLQYGVLIVQ